MKTFAELLEWREGAMEEFGDPAEAVCTIFARFRQVAPIRDTEEITCAIRGLDLVLWLGLQLPVSLRVSMQSSCLTHDGAVETFQVRQIARELWWLSPSLNMPGILHAFVILYDVPSPAPWERLIILPGEDRRSA